MNTEQIQSLRQQIDTIDEQIQNLINSRANLAKQVAVAKKHHEHNPIFIAQSEKHRY